MAAPDAAVAAVLALFAAHGSGEYVGEAVSQAEHAAQAAAHAAATRAGDDVVAAALLHDVGHMLGLAAPPGAHGRMGDCGVVAHEAVGADWLASLGFPPSVTGLVREHVQAKRYLCAARPGYADRLSAASRTTLGWQGGPMTPAEVAAFERHPRRETILRMRGWDEAAKVPGADVPAVASYAPLLARLVVAAAAPAEAAAPAGPCGGS
jgi:phosphonate degradation associated HDIG domain protein